MVQLFIIQGPRQSGKTTFLRALFSHAHLSNISVYAVIEENERDTQGVPISLAFHTLETDTTRLLAKRESVRPYPPFQFRQEVFDAILYELRKASRICDLVIIDEIGPYEILEQKGLWPFFRDLPTDRNLTLAIGIRPDLVDLLLRAFADWNVPYQLMAILPMAQNKTPTEHYAETITACCQSLSLDL